MLRQKASNPTGPATGPHLSHNGTSRRDPQKGGEGKRGRAQKKGKTLNGPPTGQKFHQKVFSTAGITS